MATNYTDVDRLILERWQDVLGLRAAFDDLQDRIRDTIADVGGRLARWGKEFGYEIETVAKESRIHAWKASWANRRGEPALYFTLEGFAPVGYRKVDADSPSIWLITRDLDTIKMKEAERAEFVRQLKAALGDRAREWENDDTDPTDEPLGKYFSEVTLQDRVSMVAEPDKLYDFASRAFQSAFTLSDAIDQTLAKFRSG